MREEGRVERTVPSMLIQIDPNVEKWVSPGVES